MNRLIAVCSFFLLTLIAFTGCSSTDDSLPPAAEQIDQVFTTTLPSVRLGDGVPLNLEVTTRWTISDYETFSAQYSTADSFNRQILQPRQMEIVSNIANQYPSVDSVFATHRTEFISTIKTGLRDRSGESSIEVKEVIVSRILFPSKFVQAKEEIGLQSQELQRIQRKNVVDVEAAKAAEIKALADGKVAIAQAESAGRLQDIQAKTEKSRRESELAKAETQRQVSEKNAYAEARKKELLAQADVKKQKDLNLAEIEKVRGLQQVELDKHTQEDQIEFARQMELAKLCQENPTYASFLVNRELASKVQIAVLPSSAEMPMFGDLMKTGMGK